MHVPCSHPGISIRIDIAKEQKVKQPDMHIFINIKAMIQLEHPKKRLPFAPKAISDIHPQALNADVVDASVRP